MVSVYLLPELKSSSGKPEYELMQTAWRERNPEARIKAAKEAIAINPECATVYSVGMQFSVKQWILLDDILFFFSLQVDEIILH